MGARLSGRAGFAGAGPRLPGRAARHRPDAVRHRTPVRPRHGRPGRRPRLGAVHRHLVRRLRVADVLLDAGYKAPGIGLRSGQARPEGARPDASPAASRAQLFQLPDVEHVLSRCAERPLFLRRHLCGGRARLVDRADRHFRNNRQCDGSDRRLAGRPRRPGVRAETRGRRVHRHPDALLPHRDFHDQDGRLLRAGGRGGKRKQPSRPGLLCRRRADRRGRRLHPGGLADLAGGPVERDRVTEAFGLYALSGGRPASSVRWPSAWRPACLPRRRSASPARTRSASASRRSSRCS